MSLTQWVAEPHVRERFDRIIPRYERRPLGSLLVARGESDAAMLGVALDYAIRLELQRRFPSAVQTTSRLSPEQDMLAFHAFAVHRKYFPAHVTAMCESLFLTPREPHVSATTLALRAVQLAHLDVIIRSGLLYFDRRGFLNPPHLMVDEVKRLVDVVPFQALRENTIHVNPTFGAHSSMVAGADGDLICGARLIDIKTVSNLVVERKYVRQVLGYCLLAKWERQIYGSFPDVREGQIYFARHGKLVTLFSMDDVVQTPAFAETEIWLKRSARDHGDRAGERLIALLGLPPND